MLLLRIPQSESGSREHSWIQICLLLFPLDGSISTPTDGIDSTSQTYQYFNRNVFIYHQICKLFCEICFLGGLTSRVTLKGKYLFSTGTEPTIIPKGC